MKPQQSPSTAITAASPLKRAHIKPSVNSKRQRNQTDENEYWLRLPDDVLEYILLSATRDPNGLFGLEASCKTWNEATSRCWRLLAKDHFNLVAKPSSALLPDGYTCGKQVNLLTATRSSLNQTLLIHI